MDNRALAVSVCGGIVGVIIAGGALALGNPPVTGSALDVAFYTVPENIGNSRGRYIEDSGVRIAEPEVRKYPTVREESASSAPVEEAEPTSCETAVAIAEDMRASLKKTLPRDPATRRTLQDAVDALAAAYCPAAEAPSADKPAVRRNNKCEQYVSNALRHTQCKINETHGQPYRGY